VGIPNKLSLMIALAIGSTVAQADVIAGSANLPPISGEYTIPDTCVPAVCVANIRVYGFQITGDTFASGNESVSTNALFAAGLFQNGGAGLPLGILVLTGDVDFQFNNRSSSTETGTFASLLTGLDLSGTFNGHSVEAQLNSGSATTGSTTVSDAGNGMFRINSFFDVFTELSIDHGAFTPGPPRVATLVPTPEPGDGAMAISGLMAVAGLLRRRRNRV
jgi:hypothetical protein